MNTAFKAQLLKTNFPMSSSEGCQFHAIETSILVGFVAYKIRTRGIWMPQLIVHNGFRSNGLGTDLLEHVVQRGNNLSKLFIDTIVHEEAALNWLKSKGFVASYIKRGYFGDRDGIQFRKML